MEFILERIHQKLREKNRNVHIKGQISVRTPVPLRSAGICPALN
jgi:hypothetical protein